MVWRCSASFPSLPRDTRPLNEVFNGLGALAEDFEALSSASPAHPPFVWHDHDLGHAAGGTGAPVSADDVVSILGRVWGLLVCVASAFWFVQRMMLNVQTFDVRVCNGRACVCALCSYVFGVSRVCLACHPIQRIQERIVEEIIEFSVSSFLFFVVQQAKEFDGKELESTMQVGLRLVDKRERSKHEGLNEMEPLKTMTKEDLSDKVDKGLLNEKLALDENAAHLEHAVKEIVDVRVAQEMEEVVGIVSFIPQERWRLAPWSKPRTRQLHRDWRDTLRCSSLSSLKSACNST